MLLRPGATHPLGRAYTRPVPGCRRGHNNVNKCNTDEYAPLVKQRERWGVLFAQRADRTSPSHS
eukprot:9820364-Lingulodinium_polyedra.AAC.1